MPRENIIWSIDPFASRKISLAKSRHMLATLQKSQPFTVEPVSVVSPKEARWPLEFEERWSEKFVEVAENSLGDIGRRMRMPEVAKAKILVQASVKKEDAIKALLEFALAENAKMILVNLHSHRGLKRFKLGSFTESLISISSLPVLTIRANTRVPNEVKTILFPTDLTALGARYLKHVISISRNFSAKLVILHRLEVPSILAADWIGFAAAAEMESMREAIRENEAAKEIQGSKFLTEAKQAGIEAEFVLERGMTSLGQAIVAASGRLQADIIAVAAQDQSLTQKILGSTSSEVLQLSPRPVLLLPGRV